MTKISINNLQKLYFVAFGSSLVGLVASFLQAIQTINYYKFPEKDLSCDLNSVFNCAGVFGAWQSSVFGFSNSLMCIVFFTLMLGVSLVGMTGSKINKNVRLLIQFLALFFLGFGAWYLWSSTFVIAALCIYCIFCYSAVIALNFALLRINIKDLPISNKVSGVLEGAIAKNYDILFWIIWASLIASMFVYKFV